MSHWGPTYGEIMGAERRRKELNTSAQELLDAVLKTIADTAQEQYSITQVMAVSPHSHAEALRARIAERVTATAWSLNVEPTPKEST
jgi:BMFP domain-containing protein YqiC